MNTENIDISPKKPCFPSVYAYFQIYRETVASPFNHLVTGEKHKCPVTFEHMLLNFVNNGGPQDLRARFELEHPGFLAFITSKAAQLI